MVLSPLLNRKSWYPLHFDKWVGDNNPALDAENNLLRSTECLHQAEGLYRQAREGSGERGLFRVTRFVVVMHFSGMPIRKKNWG